MPVGVAPPAPPPTTSLSFSSQSPKANSSSVGVGHHLQPQTQFLIHEEGGLERWFNLTILNVGLEAVADYTCVAVNAGGVMEENISLTFEEPEPVNRNHMCQTALTKTAILGKRTLNRIGPAFHEKVSLFAAT